MNNENGNRKHDQPSKAYLVFGVGGSGCLFALSVVSLGAVPAVIVLLLPLMLIDFIGHGYMNPDAMWGLAIFTSGITCATVFVAGVVAQAVKRSPRPQSAKWILILVLFVGIFLIPLLLATINTHWE